MNKNQDIIQKRLSEIGIIPVIKLKNIDDTIPLGEALINGNVNTAEVTFRAAGAEKVIEILRKNYPDLIVGAGTIITMEQLMMAINAGALFIVSPGYDEEIVSYCVENNIPIFPGCVTPTEIQMAIKHNLNILKFFPAQQYGGLSTISALSGPFNGIKFIPTGGVNLNNLEEYIKNKNVAACGGSFMVDEKLINNKNWSEITRICLKSVEIIEDARRQN